MTPVKGHKTDCFFIIRCTPDSPSNCIITPLFCRDAVINNNSPFVNFQEWRVIVKNVELLFRM